MVGSLKVILELVWGSVGPYLDCINRDIDIMTFRPHVINEFRWVGKELLAYATRLGGEKRKGGEKKKNGQQEIDKEMNKEMKRITWNAESNVVGASTVLKLTFIDEGYSSA